MRIAALALGIVAGLVASLILALGGLDALTIAADERQLSLIRFGLFIVANFGVLGAGVVLAAPLAGSILLVLAALAWIIAAAILHHGPDYVMLTSPGLLVAAAVLAFLAYLRGRGDRRFTQADRAGRRALEDDEIAQEPEDEDEDEGGAVAVGASFFGDHGTATPMRGAMGRTPEPPPSAFDRGAAAGENWEPIRRRVEPPRTKPMFRSPEEEYDEEGSFSRAARLISSVLSFGLYAGLAAAAALIVVNLRDGDARPTVTRIEASAASTAAPSSLPSSSTPPLEVATTAPTLTPPSLPGSAVAPMLAPPISTTPPAAETALPSSTAPQSVALAEAAAPSETPAVQSAPALAAPELASSALPSASEPPPEDLTMGQHVADAPLMPYPLPPAIAAERNRPPAQRPASPPPQRADTGL